MTDFLGPPTLRDRVFELVRELGFVLDDDYEVFAIEMATTNSRARARGSISDAVSYARRNGLDALRERLERSVEGAERDAHRNAFRARGFRRYFVAAVDEGMRRMRLAGVREFGEDGVVDAEYTQRLEIERDSGGNDEDRR